jgi:hydrogenase nickel incorporation protein HypB
MFQAVDLVLLTKSDLLAHLPDVEPGIIRDALARGMPEPRMLVVSATTGEGLEDWARWLRDLRARQHRDEAAVASQSRHHDHHHATPVAVGSERRSGNHG